MEDCWVIQKVLLSQKSTWNWLASTVTSCDFCSDLIHLCWHASAVCDWHSPPLLVSFILCCSCPDVAVLYGPLIIIFVHILMLLTQRMHHNSKDTAPHPKPYGKDQFLRYVLSLSMSLHITWRGRQLPDRMRHRWSALDFNCNVIFLTLEMPLLSYV